MIQLIVQRFVFVLLLSWTINIQHLVAGDTYVRSNPDELNILTYNVKFLPRVLIKHAQRPVKRAKLIPEQLINDSIDVIVLQEAFDKKANRIMKRLLIKEFPYQAGPANKGASFKLTSGVIMFSKLPIKQIDEVDFNTCDGSDCWARKGGLLCEVTMPNRIVHIMGTHAEAGGTFDMKVGQFYQLKELMERNYKAGVPQIACGDFNCSISNKPLYDTLKTILQTEDGPLTGDLLYTSDHLLNDMHRYDSTQRNLIDHIFYRSGGVLPAFIQRKVVRYRKEWSKSNADLSDHFAVKMKIVF